MKIETIEIAGLAGALTALRLPYGKEVRSKMVATNKHWMEGIDTPYNVWKNMSEVEINNKDLTLMQTLVKRGDEHAKVVRGIMVWAKIECPIYLAREMETYNIGRERLSCTSTMHQECKGLSGEELQKVKAELPMGTPCTFVDTYSYQTLRRIVAQRHDHRLPEWHEFVNWVRTLPLAEELIFTGLNL